MSITLIKIPSHPDEWIATKIGTYVVGGAFFLDFSRPIEVAYRTWFGRVDGYGAPVVHECEKAGGFVMSVHRSDPYFNDIRNLWKEHFPRPREQPATVASGLEIIGDFATQFPDDCQPPAS